MSGNIQDPIAVYSDQEQVDKIKERFQAQLSEHRIKDALITNDAFEIARAVIKSLLPGQQKSKDKSIRKKIISYFESQAKINIAKDNFFPRLQADYSQATPLPTSTILFGVDFISMPLLKAMFKSYDPQIIWINESNCKLIFANKQHTSKAFFQNLLNRQTKVQQQQQKLPVEWFQLKPYTQYVFNRPLLMRYATSKQQEVEKNGDQDRFINYEEAKKGLVNWLLREFQAEDKYNEIVRLQQISKRRKGSFKSRSRSRSKNSEWEQYQPHRMREFKNREKPFYRNHSVNQDQYRNINLSFKESFLHATEEKNDKINLSISFRSQNNDQKQKQKQNATSFVNYQNDIPENESMKEKEKNLSFQKQIKIKKEQKWDLNLKEDKRKEIKFIDLSD